VACAQNDIKRVLAYSTISQLGYMFLAVGSGAYVAAIFHMVTHAFFKALLFLGAGAVIHGLHDEQDMKRMGALRKYLPITSGTFIAGWLAIAGVPPFAGFWSKDEILVNAWDKSPLLWAVGVVTALLTAYYMTRQVRLVFYGEARWKGDEEHHAEPHEAPWTMALPLVVLAALSVVGGALNLPFGDDLAVLGNFLHPVVEISEHELTATGAMQVTLAAISTAAALFGLTMGWRIWSRRTEDASLEPAILQRAWGVDQAVSALVGGPGREFAEGTASVDRNVVDGAFNGLGSNIRRGSEQLRKLQTGYVRNYALGIAGGSALLLAYVVIRATG
jgi:NADH-quinone oxidoreductase subunit L